MRSQLQGICDALASLVFSAPCRICARMLDTGTRIPFCRECVALLTQTLPEPQCARCGRPIVSSAVAEGALPPLCHLCASARMTLISFEVSALIRRPWPRDPVVEVWGSHAVGRLVCEPAHESGGALGGGLCGRRGGTSTLASKPPARTRL